VRRSSYVGGVNQLRACRPVPQPQHYDGPSLARLLPSTEIRHVVFKTFRLGVGPSLVTMITWKLAAGTATDLE